MIGGNKCTDISLDSSEQIFGTAPYVNFWFLLEYNSEWKENVFKSNNFSKNMLLKLSDLLKANDNSRIQWIKNEESSKDKINLYIVESSKQKKRTFKIILSSYEEILDLNTEEIFNQRYDSTQPLALVCTHKNYDNCCGDMGYALYESIHKTEDKFDVWQTTHLGGHRFAANLLILPDGLYYGRVNQDAYQSLRNNYLNRLLNLDHLRGRCYYDKYTQAAEYYLRHNTNNNELETIDFLSLTKTEESTTCITFINTRSKSTYRVYIKEEKDAVEICSGCTDNTKKSISQFRLMGIEKLN